jgi:hypothetical protein
MIPLYGPSSRAEIQRRARQLFEQAGCPSRRDLDHRFQAKAQFDQNIRINQWRRSRPQSPEDAEPR